MNKDFFFEKTKNVEKTQKLRGNDQSGTTENSDDNDSNNDNKNNHNDNEVLNNYSDNIIFSLNVSSNYVWKCLSYSDFLMAPGRLFHKDKPMNEEVY